jgi:toxin ParE1/3/4
MSLYNIHFLKPAEIEFCEAFDWYDEKQKGLGNRFLKEVSKYLDSIADNPFKFAAKYDNELRFAPLKIFPFVIAYWIENETVFVASIFHTSRNPKKFLI